MTSSNGNVLGRVIAARPEATRSKNDHKEHFQQTPSKTTYTNETPSMSRNKTVNIEPLKIVAKQILPREHPLKILLDAERSVLKPEEYIAKLESWLCLLEIK